MRLWWSMMAVAVVGCSADEGGGGGRLVHRDSGESDAGGTAPSVDAGEDPPKPVEPEMTGEATYYYYSSGGACGLEAPDDLLIAAINDEQYSDENCGRCASVTGPNGTVTVEILDKCPGCHSGDLDLSEEAFEKIAAKTAGRVKITWSFVDCPP